MQRSRYWLLNAYGHQSKHEYRTGSRSDRVGHENKERILLGTSIVTVVSLATERIGSGIRLPFEGGHYNVGEGL